MICKTVKVLAVTAIACALTGCFEKNSFTSQTNAPQQSQETENAGQVQTQAQTSQTAAGTVDFDDKLTSVSLLRDRLPATCFVRDSENLPFCMPGDMLVYEPSGDKKKQEQTSINEVLGSFCDLTKPYTINGDSVICAFHQNRSYNATPVNQQAIVASNIQTGRDYLAHVAGIKGIQELSPGIYMLYLKRAEPDAPSITQDVAAQLETKLLTPNLKVHSYMLNDMLTLDSLATGNPFAQIFPLLKRGDIVRVYIDFARYPNVWNVDSSLQGLPYIWEVNVLNIGAKPVPIPQDNATTNPAEALEAPATN